MTDEPLVATGNYFEPVGFVEAGTRVLARPGLLGMINKKLA
jgi:hypothetical protein